MIITTEKPQHLYRKGVGIMLLNKENKILVCKREGTRGNMWQMPQGGLLDNFEEEEKAALRELKEETGIHQIEIITQSIEHYYYNWPYHLQKKFWNSKYLGQKQRWFLMRFNGLDHHIDLHTTSHPEFTAYQWTDFDSILKSVVYFKEEMYKGIVNEFKEFLKNND